MGTLGSGGGGAEKTGKGASIFGHYFKRGRKQTRYKGAGVEIRRYKGARLAKEKGRGSWRKVSGILVGGGWEIDKGWGGRQGQAKTGKGRPGRG